MNKIDDSGPAFPVADMGQHGAYGMTLRDYFAAKAMQGIVANSNRDYAWADLAAEAFALADAMLATRIEEQTK